MENIKMDELINKIRGKKELKGLSDEFIISIIEEYKKEYPAKYLELEKKKFNPKSKEFDDIKKFTRKKLRILHGVFQKNKLSDKKKEDFLENNDFDFNSKKTQNFLKSHLSTYERLKFYDSVYNEIQKHTKIESLVDLACGLNPLSYTLLNDLKKVYCADINSEEIKFIKEYFKKNKEIEGEAQLLDLTKTESINEINTRTKNTDCTLLFKTLDSLEYIERGISKKLLENINSKCIVVSFSNKTISGKNNIKSERWWFKKILEELEKKGKNTFKFEFGNEEYFLIKN